MRHKAKLVGAALLLATTAAFAQEQVHFMLTAGTAESEQRLGIIAKESDVSVVVHPADSKFQRVESSSGEFTAFKSAALKFITEISLRKTPSAKQEKPESAFTVMLFREGDHISASSNDLPADWNSLLKKIEMISGRDLSQFRSEKPKPNVNSPRAKQ